MYQDVICCLSAIPPSQKFPREIGTSINVRDSDSSTTYLLSSFIELCFLNFQCVKKSGLDSDQVAKCLRTKQGVDLQLDSEYLTLLVRPKFIPTVTVDAVRLTHKLFNFNRDLVSGKWT